MIALLERERSGRGQWVQTNLLSSQIMMLDYQAMRWLMDRVVLVQRGNDHPQIIPTGAFRSSDGFFTPRPWATKAIDVYVTPSARQRWHPIHAS